MDRRNLLKAGMLGLASQAAGAGALAQSPAPAGPDGLRDIATAPVLKTQLLPDEVIIASIEALKIDDQFAVRVRSTEGLEGIAMCNPSLMRTLHPILTQRLAPYFMGKDARDLEAIQAHLVNSFFYKWQGLPFWAPYAWLELAILDLLGKASGQPMTTLLGDKVRDSCGLYYASPDRGSSAEAVIEELRGYIAESGTKAVKFRIGARMSTTPESDARDRILIPMARRELGDDAILYADANGSFSVEQSLATGRMMEEYNYGFFEEPVRFDDFDGTKAVTDGLSMPVAGGEIESSLIRFEEMISHRVVDMVQPDLIYLGGLIRSLKVARMAEAAGMPTLPHMSDSGLGILYVLHFAGVVPNTTDFQEYKGEEGVPYEVIGTGSPLVPVDGRMDVPTAPGLGIVIDPEWLARAEIL